jgi:hypothetical protein
MKVKMPTGFYFIVLLFVVVLLMSAGKQGFQPYEKSNMWSSFRREGFQSGFPLHAHSAASVSGSEKPALESSKGVLGVFEEDGLKASSLEVKPINDPMSKLRGGQDCVGKSNYSNSLGGLCITDNIKDQLVTRGGNQSSKPCCGNKLNGDNVGMKAL